MSNGFLSGLFDRLSSNAQKQDGRVEGFLAYSDMHFCCLTGREVEAKLAMAAVEKVLCPDRAWTYEAYPRFRVEGVVFVEIYFIPTGDVRDLNVQPEYAAVIPGTNPQLVHMPNKELFAQFMKAVRANPNLMTPAQRLKTALVLAIGDGECIKEDGCEPAWTEKDGTLVISCHRYIRSNYGKVRPKRVVCTLTVDKNQDFVLEQRDFEGIS